MIDKINVKFIAGTTIEEAIDEAWKCHIAKCCDVSFSFNGSTITITGVNDESKRVN